MSSSRDVGFAIIPAEILEIKNGYAIAVYAAIAKHADRNGEAFPSVRRLGEMTGWSRPTVRKAISELEAAGAIVKEARASNGFIRSNLYRLPFHGRKSPRNGMETSLPRESRMETSLPTLATSFTPVGNDVATEQEPENNNQRTRESAAGADSLTLRGFQKKHGGTSTIPENFAPDPEQRRAIQEEHHLTDAFLDFETKQFRDNYKATEDLRADWQAAWRKWIRGGIAHSRKHADPTPFQPRKADPPLRNIGPRVEGEGNPLEAIRKAKAERMRNEHGDRSANDGIAG